MARANQTKRRAKRGASKAKRNNSASNQVYLKQLTEQLNKIHATPKQAQAKRNYIREWRLFRDVPMQKDLAALTKVIDPRGKGLDAVTICKLEAGTLQYNETHIRLISLALRVAPSDIVGKDPMEDVLAAYRNQSAISSDELAQAREAAK